MIQGTGSHVGKTLIVAGLCRLFHQDGVRVAPFKSQNMALNAYVTRDGGEMGWAQAIQAEAAGLDPRVEMNPILLKPQSDQRSQVVLLGEVLATCAARDYYGMTGRLWRAVAESYREVARRADLVLIEGAGSPAEPNLMRRDLANMAMARLAKAPVVLVGDIERGGVFASLLGTLALLSRPDRRRVKGFIVNKFRGDPSLLAPALEFLERRARRPVLGVIPWLPRLYLPEEDCVALDERATTYRRATDPLEASPRTCRTPVKIAVVRLPRIANFTDFAPLEPDARVELVYAERADGLHGARLIILPGSKDTIADLRFLKAQGFDVALRRHVEAGGAVGGICGGYQMLGRCVADPYGLESGGEEPGLGLLPVRTILELPKVLRRVRARLLPGPWGEGSGEWEAYELHAGRTVAEDASMPLFAVRRDGGMEETEGLMSPDGRVWGTYLHGSLDTPTVRDRLLAFLEVLTPPGIPATAVDYRTAREGAYDALAGTLRASLDLPVLRALTGL